VADPEVENNLRIVEDPNSSLIMTKYLAFALIAIGGAVFIIGFLGCCGALKENKCLLGFYLFFLIIIAGAEIAAGVLGFIQKDKIESKISATLEAKWDKFNNGEASAATQEAIKYVRAQLKCCNPTPIEPDATTPTPNPDCKGHTAGCIAKLTEWVKRNAPILIGVACGFGGLEIFGIICAICLCRAVGDKDE
jgi:hypothetical protein